MLGDKVLGSVLRTSEMDFRSNFSLGGKVEAFETPKEVMRICLKIRKLIKSDFIGIDFFKNENEYIVNEIEDPVGCRMLYKTTDVNFIKEFTNSVTSSLS